MMQKFSSNSGSFRAKEASSTGRTSRARGAAKSAPLPKQLPYTIDYKNIGLLRRYIGITGKILPRRVNGLTAKEHRAMARAIRQARVAGMLPFVWLTELGMGGSPPYPRGPQPPYWLILQLELGVLVLAGAIGWKITPCRT